MRRPQIQTEPSSKDDAITTWLGRLAAGDERAPDRLAEAVSDRLEQIAVRAMKESNDGKLDGLTLEPRVLAHDALLAVLSSPVEFENRRHLFAYASTIILRAMIDYQRARRAQRRGGGQVRVTLSALGGVEAVDLEGLPPVLEELDALDRRQADVVRLRVFWGGSVDEVAEALGVSKSTVERDWRFARRWLALKLRPPEGMAGAQSNSSP